MPRRPSFLKALVSHKWEVIVLGVALIGLVVASLCVGLAPKENASTAKVYLRGEELYSLSLDAPREIEIPLDDGVMVLSVKDGGIAVTSSPCPSQYCVHQRYKTKVGESILCAHEGVAIYLYGEEAITEVHV